MDKLTSRERIYFTVLKIPKGCVATYGQVARLAGLPGYARIVGQILSQLPSDSRLPWHRIISGSGKISIPEHSDSFVEQRKRLIKEGIKVRHAKINLKEYQWQP